MQKIFFPTLLALSLSLILPVESARADSTTTISSDTSGNTYNVGPNNTFTVNSGKTLSYSSNGAIITVDNSGSGTTLITNNGTISNTSTGSNARDVQINPSSGSPNVSITNGSSSSSAAIMQTVGSDVIHAKTSSASSNVSIYNYGTINAKNTGASSNNGQQAIDFNNQTAGSLLIDNYNTGIIEAYESDPIQVPVGGTITINNDGLIQGTRAPGTTGSVDGINGETTSGQTINNGTGIGGETVTNAQIIGAKHGITADGSAATSSNHWTMSVTNGVNGTIQGNDGSGINIDGTNGYESVTITNRGTITGNGVSGDGDGVDVDGLVNLDNYGTIKSLGAHNDTSEGVTVGGGSIKNEVGALIEGDGGAAGVGITLAGVDKDSNDNPIPPQGIYAATTVDNFGTIKGQTGAGIQATSTLDTFGITVTNEVGGTIEGAGTGAAIQFAAPANSSVVNKIINAGTITPDSSGKAIDLGGTNNEVDIVGGAATVAGSISGGGAGSASKFVVDATAGGTVTNGSFSYSSTISNFATAEVKTGTFKLNGTISGGTTTIDSGATLAGNAHVGALVIAAGGTLSPGNSPGKTTATSAVLNPTGNFLLQVDNDGSTGAAGTNWDQLAVSGTVNVAALGTGAGQQFVFNLQSLTATDAVGALASFDKNVDHVWHDVVTSTGFVGALSSDEFTVDASQFANPTAGTFSIEQDGNSLDLVYTAAPEPGTWAMIIGGLGLLVGFTRWRKLSI